MAKVNPIPEGYPQVIPYLYVDGAGAAIDFYGKVLGTKERMRMGGPDGKVGHAELELGDSVIMIADEFPDMGVKGPKSVGGSPGTGMGGPVPASGPRGASVLELFVRLTSSSSTSSGSTVADAARDGRS